jgi:hypothetical protein
VSEPETYGGRYKRANPEKAREYQRRDNAKRAKAKRDWARENRKRCLDCGDPIWHENRCRPCFNAERARQHEALLDRVESMWHQGLSMRAMAEALGRTGRGVNNEVDELRKAGRIGYRYKAYESRAA